MSVQIKVIAVQGQVLKQTGSSSKQTMVKNGSKLALKGKLILSEDASIIVKLSDGRIVEIHGRDLINQGGEFDLGVLGENTQPLSDLEKLESFATNYKNIVIDESQSNIVRLEDGRVFQKQGKDYVEIAGDSFEDPNAAQGGFRFVQLTRIGDNPVADSVNPVQLHRVDDSIAPLGITYPEPTLTDKPFEHGMGGGAWTPLAALVVEPVVIAYPTANVSSDTKYEGVDLIHNVHLSTPSTMDTTVTVTLTSNTATIGEDTGRVQYTVDGGKTWVTVNAVELADGSFDITVPAGSQDVQIRVETKQDSILEGEENYSISVSTPYQDTPTTGKGTIIDDARPIDPENVTPPGTVTPPPDAKDPIKPTPDNPAGTPDDDRPTVSVSSDTKYEGVDLIHNVHLSTLSTIDTTVTVTLTSNTATIGEDTGRVQYTVDGGKTWVTVNAVELADGSFDITVPAGSQDVQIRVETKQDSILEGEESYQISVTTPYQDSPAVGKGTILDVEIPIPVVPTISVDLVARNDTIENKEEIPNPATTEIKGVVTHISDGEVIKLTITDTKGHSKEVVVTVKEGQYGTTVDLTGFEGEVTVRATVNSDQTITAQDVEQITPVVVPPIVPPVIPPVIPPVSRPTATITGDTKYEGSDLIHDVTLSNPSDSATTVTVTLTHDTTEAADLTGIQYTTDGGTTWQTATPNGSGSFDVTVPAGGTGFQIRVGTDGDNVLEGRESYDISVKTASQAAADSATGTIVDDGSVIPPTDPVTPPGTVTPPPGTPPYDPTQPNGPVDDDRPTALVNSDSKYEGNQLIHDIGLSNLSETTTSIEVTITPTGTNAIEANDIEAVLYTTDGGATWTTVPGFVLGTSFTVTHPANETAGQVQVRVVSKQDTVLEGSETYEISVSTPSQTTAGTGTGTIVDDGSTITPPTNPPVTPPVPVTPPTATDLPPGTPPGNPINDDRPTALVNSDSKYEGNQLIHDIGLSNLSETTTSIEVTITPTGTNAIEANDIEAVLYTTDGGATWTTVPGFVLGTSFTVTHPANETAGQVQVRVVSKQDTVLEGSETYEISVSTPSQMTAGTGTGTIVDDGSTITPPTNPPVTPPVPVTPPTATDLPPGTPPGNPINDDRPTALVNSDSKYEGNQLIHDIGLSNLSETTTSIEVTITPTGTNAIEANDIEAVLYTTDGGATWTTVPGFVLGTSFTVTHPANETAGQVQVRVVSKQDTVLEGSETYEISVSTPSQTTAGTGTGTIVDDGSTITPPTNPPVTPPVPVTPPTATDLPPGTPPGNPINDDRPTATVTGDTKVEGSVLIHDVTLSNTSETNTTVNVKLGATGDTATLSGAGADVDLTPSQINIVIGSTTYTLADLITSGKATGTGSDFTLTLTPTEQAGGFQVRISSIDDTAVESDESYTISVATPKQVAGDAPVATNTGTITDNDVAAVLNITGPATINEAAGTATYTVTLSASSTSTVTVNFATANGTATSGTDYTSTSGTLTFAPGVTTQTITVPILNDHTIESNENYTISLNTPTNATIGTGSATTTIIDDDVAPMIDLDDDNSSGETGADYRTNYTVGAAAGISIGDTDLKVTDSNVPSGAPNTAHIKSATITLTNAQAGDVFTAGALPSDITASKVGNTITLTSASGSTLANFEAAIKAVTFKASDTTPHPEVDRIVKVKVTDIGGNESNEATSTISVNVIQAPGQPGEPTNGNDTITGGNGDDIIVSDVGGLGVPDQISAKYNLAFIVDVSGSMAWSMDSLSSGALNNGNSRLDILKDALREYIGGYFMDALDGTPGGGLINQNVELNIGLIPFGSTAGTRRTMRISLSGGDTWDDVNNKINALATTGSTNYEAGFNSAITWFQGLNSAYTDATGKAVNGYVNMTYFLTDGDPNLVGSGTSASVANALTAARTSFETLVSTTGINSSVSAIGMGAAANKSYLSLFDNTVKGVTDGFNGLTGLASHTVDAGTGEGWRSNSINSTPIANFETATGLNAVSAWTASGDAVAPAIVNTTVKNYVGTSSPDAAANTAVASNRLELDDATQNNGQAAIYTSASFTVTQNNAYAVFDYSHTGFNRGPATVVNTEQGTSSPASNVNYYYNSDLFTWTLQKEVSSGVWINVDTGTNAASIRGGTSNVPMSSQFLENGKTYRYVFTVEDKTTGSENYQVRIDNIRLHYPDSGSDTISKNVGEARTVMTGPELVEVLKSGSVKPNPNGGGNDTVHGGAGHDIIFGDSINTDWLSWAGRDIYDVNAPNGLGSGIAALDKYLQSHGFATGSGGTVESIDRYNFIKANHAAFSGDSINVGGNDILYGDAGNDILYGQGGIDTLYGGDGNDILYGGKGNDVLWGNAGADIFAWAAKDIGTTALPDTDTIKDFNKDDGDILDAKALLNALGWTGSGNLSDFVTVTNGSNSINIHDATHTNIVTIVVESTEFTNFSSIADMITKTNFQS